MRHLHPAAVAGLVLNSVLAYIVLSFLSSLDLLTIPPLEGESIEVYIKYRTEIRNVIYSSLMGQSVGLILLSLGYSLGLPLACIAAIFMLPASLVFIIGCIFTQGRVKYTDFQRASDDHTSAFAVFPSAGVRKALIAAAAAGLGLLAAGATLGLMDLNVLFISFIIASLYIALRSRSHHALSLHAHYFTVTPGIFSERLMIRYADVELATLTDDGDIHFRVVTPEGLRLLVWSLKSVEENSRRSALESLGATLSQHRVPLQ